MYFCERFPDLVCGGLFASGYTRIDHYVSYDDWLGRRSADPMLFRTMMASLSSADNEIHAPNLKGLEDRLLLRHGAADDNVPISHSRRLASLIAGQTDAPAAVQSVN